MFVVFLCGDFMFYVVIEVGVVGIFMIVFGIGGIFEIFGVGSFVLFVLSNLEVMV